MEEPTLRARSAPGRIEGRAAQSQRQAQAAPAAAQALLASREVAAAPGPTSPPIRSPGLSVGAIAALLAILAALLAAKSRRASARRAQDEAAARAAAAPPPQPDDEAALRQAAAQPAQADAMADYLCRAQKVPDFLERCPGRPDAFLDAYGHAFLRRGAWQTASALFAAKQAPGPRDAVLRQALQAVLAARERRPGDVQAETVRAAAELSQRGGHEDALALLNPAVVQKAAGSAPDARAVAGVFRAAGKAPEFLAQARMRKHPQFYGAYAQAFHGLQDPATALELLRLKRPMDAADYALFVACHRELGSLGRLPLAQILEAERMVLAQALLEAGEEEAALKALLEGRTEALSRAELCLALRLCARRRDVLTAGRLFGQIKLTVGLADAPELYLAFASVCEAAGQARESKEIYTEVLRQCPGQAEAAAGLRRLGGEG